MPKLYVIVDRALKTGAKIAQACHTLFAFSVEHPDEAKAWHADSNNLVVLHIDGLADLAGSLEAAGYKTSRFYEPDLGGQLTGVAVEPAAWRSLSRLQLAQ